jgi:hypothetical protein
MSDTIINTSPSQETPATERGDVRARIRQDKHSTLHLACFRPVEKTPAKV